MFPETNVTSIVQIVNQVQYTRVLSLSITIKGSAKFFFTMLLQQHHTLKMK